MATKFGYVLASVTAVGIVAGVILLAMKTNQAIARFFDGLVTGSASALTEGIRTTSKAA